MTSAASGDDEAPKPSVAEEVAKADPPPVELNQEQQERYGEAAVKLAEIAAAQAADDRKMRREIVDKVFIAAVCQVVIADLVFLVYAFAKSWDIPSGTMNAWLGATVVQVIAVALVITRSLFPNRDKKS